MTLLALLVLSGPALDVRIEGEGFLRFLRHGSAAYQKEARLVLIDGRLCHSDGPPVTPAISAPSGARSLAVSADGHVSADGQRVGRLVLAVFGADLRPIESGGWLIAAGRPRLAYPGSDGAGAAATSASAPAGPRPEPAAGPGRIEVIGERITLADVLQIPASDSLYPSAAAADLGAAPAPGQERVISGAIVSSRAKGLGLAPPAWTSVAVRRASQTVAHEKFVQSALEAISGGGLQITPSSPPERAMDAPVGALELRALSPMTNGSTISMTVEVWVDQKRFNSRNLKFSTVSSVDGFRPGQAVKAILRSAGARIETAATVRSVNRSQGTVSVATESGAAFTGRPNSSGQIEVIL